MCIYCNEDRLVGKGAIYLGKIGTVVCINKKGELVVNINGEQTNIVVRNCPFCGEELKED